MVAAATIHTKNGLYCKLVERNHTPSDDEPEPPAPKQELELV